MSDGDIILLNVGGFKYTTTRQTLCKVPNSMLSSMFSGQFQPGKQIDGRYFIDRNGRIFEYILDYLRNLDQWFAPNNDDLKEQIRREAEYFGLMGLVEMANAGIKDDKQEENTMKKQTNPSFFVVTIDTSSCSYHVDFSPRIPSISSYFDRNIYLSSDLSRLVDMILKGTLMGGYSLLHITEAHINDRSHTIMIFKLI